MPVTVEPFYVPEVRVSGCSNITEVEPGIFVYTYYSRQWCPLAGSMESVVCARHAWTLPALKQVACMTRSVFGFLALND